MATQDAKRRDLRDNSAEDTYKFKMFKWVLGADDDGAPVSIAGHTDRSIQVEGTFGGATVRIEGRNNPDGSAWNMLTNSFSVDLSITNDTPNKLQQINEVSHMIRPRVVGGDGTTNLIVTLFAVVTRGSLSR